MSTTAAAPRVRERSRTRAWARAWAPWVVGGLSGLVNGIAFWVPTPWGDEAATRSATERSVGDLLEMTTRHIDAVHATYYLLVHPFVVLGGASPVVLRLPSVLAIGLATAAVTVLGRQLVSPRFGVVVGVVFAVLPQVGFDATEARSPAVVAAVTAWSMVATLKLLESSARRWDVAFVALGALAVAVSVLNGLALASIALAVGVVPRWRHRVRRVTVDTAVAMAVASPVVVMAWSQKAQVAWLPGVDLGTLRQLAQHQWFDDAALFAVLAWLLMGCAATVFVRRRRRAEPWTGWDDGTVLAVAIVFVPSTFLFVVTAAGAHFYVPRYVAGSLPAVALLMGSGIWSLRHRGRLVVLVPLLLGLAAVPNFVAQRQVDAKAHGWAAAMDAVRADAAPGTPVLLQNDGSLLPLRTLYPSVFEQHPDIGLGTSHLEDGGLWDVLVPPEVAAARATGYAEVVVIARAEDWARSPDLSVLQEAGFSPTATSTFDQVLVTTMRRAPS